MTRSDGQATVELVLVIPLLLVFVLGLVQVGRVIGAQLAVTDAARAGARAASVDPRPAVAEDAAGASAHPLAEGFDVSMERSGSHPGLVTVTVACDVPPISSLPVLRRVTTRVHASATMVVEPAAGEVAAGVS